MKILTILGARPQFIKSGSVSIAFQKYNKALLENNINEKKYFIEEVIVHTGQHFDDNMSSVFFSQMSLPRPKYFLNISGNTHGTMTGRMIEAIEEVINKEKPDCLLVYGDTNSTLSGGIAAVKMHIPVAHVEAGLRSHNPYMPEEINRILTDRVSAMLFCPSETAKKNLLDEGYPFNSVQNENSTSRNRSYESENPKFHLQKIYTVGDVMYDTVNNYRPFAMDMVDLKQFGLSEHHYVLCTVHRQENTDNISRLKEIMKAFVEISRYCKVFIPLHPRTRKRIFENIEEFGIEIGEFEFLSSKNQSSMNQNDVIEQNSINLDDGNNNNIFEKSIIISEPLPYLELQRLQIGARMIFTDSGGLQKEAFFNKVPCVTLRDETEWMETVDAGWNILVGANKDRIVGAFKNFHVNEHHDSFVYGDGRAAEKIVNKIVEYLLESNESVVE